MKASVAYMRETCEALMLISIHLMDKDQHELAGQRKRIGACFTLYYVAFTGGRTCDISVFLRNRVKAKGIAGIGRTRKFTNESYLDGNLCLTGRSKLKSRP